MPDLGIQDVGGGTLGVLNSASESRCMAFHVLHDSCSMANASASTTRTRSAEIHGSGSKR